ncbi:MAG: nucleotide sugar dehydrogenase [Chloroflexi bacterium]|nr:nucleotide sugar dehydrogenase [Chloroflexota bacterium]MBU1749179.1 nucleotide sugar dehydrogenase [Chloroflexota bacterium]
MSDLESRIRDHSARICVIGLGYVGLPLAVELARAGFRVTGLDVNPARAEAVCAGRSYINDVSTADVAALVQAGRLDATADYAVLDDADVAFICVPTPFTANKAPDLSYIVSAATGIAEHLHPGMLVVLQSTTHPGTTEEDVLPILERTGLRAGVDFHLAFSPERINPGDPEFSVHNTPKVVGGLTPRCSELTALVFEQIMPQVYVVSSPRAAELSKLLENIFRSVNIALVNELALLAERMGIDIWEVIEAAKTKPFGFMPFYPGPGVGGHCIPVDPYYLSWKAREYDFYTKFIELAAETNQRMPYHVVELLARALNQRSVPLAGARILVLGVAFKPNVDDARNSSAERVIELLLDRGAQVAYNDPYVPQYRVGPDVFHAPVTVLESVPLTAEAVSAADCVLILADHRAYDYDWLVQTARLVLDTRNATRHVPDRDRHVVRIGTPFGN